MFDCKLVVVDGRSNDNLTSRTEQTAKLQLLGQTVWIQNQPESQDWQFYVMDAGGRIVHTEHGIGTDVVLYNFENHQIPAGIYFVQLRKNFISPLPNTA